VALVGKVTEKAVPTGPNRRYGTIRTRCLLCGDEGNHLYASDFPDIVMPMCDCYCPTMCVNVRIIQDD
jgi:hypothetical protein